MLERRSFLKGLIAAPAIVAVQNIMPVKLFAPIWKQPDKALADLAYSFAQTKEIVAANAFNMEQLRDLLLPGLKEIVSTYSYPPRWPELFDELPA